nr:MAG TPA: hypothetical protein [Caudoviricetes sp.]
MLQKSNVTLTHIFLLFLIHARMFIFYPHFSV